MVESFSNYLFQCVFARQEGTWVPCVTRSVISTLRRVYTHTPTHLVQRDEALRRRVDQLLRVMVVGEVECGLAAHVASEPFDGRVVDADHGIVRVDLVTVIRIQQLACDFPTPRHTPQQSGSLQYSSND